MYLQPSAIVRSETIVTSSLSKMAGSNRREKVACSESARTRGEGTHLRNNEGK